MQVLTFELLEYVILNLEYVLSTIAVPVAGRSGPLG